MGHWKLWIAIFTALDTIWWMNTEVAASPIWPHQVTYTLQHGRYVDKELQHARYDMVLEYCRRLSRFGLIRSPTTLQHGRYVDKEGAVDCYIHSSFWLYWRRYNVVGGLMRANSGRPPALLKYQFVVRREARIFFI
eukprot:scaffold7396_cov68-Skeletonema_marinoi.AAC.2